MLRRSLASSVLALAISGCAASLSELDGRYAGTEPRGAARPDVRIAVLVTHLDENHGMDAIPKHRSSVVEAFEEVLHDATSELTNLAGYTLTTDEGPRGRGAVETRRDYRTDLDYTVHLTVLRESSFAAQAFWGLVAFSTVTLAPAPFRWQYTFHAAVYDSTGQSVAQLHRSATVTNWVQAALIVVFPFHPLEGKEEKLYSDALHDLFRQIELEGIVARPRRTG